jgi:hypothetical protein
MTYPTFIYFRNFSEMFSHGFKTFNFRLRSSCDQAVDHDTSWSIWSGARMHIKPRRGAPTEQAAHKEDTTAEIEAGPQNQVLRRTTVTVERETVSVLMRRTATAPAVASAADPTALEGGADPPGKDQDAALLVTRNELSEGKL